MGWLRALKLLSTSLELGQCPCSEFCSMLKSRTSRSSSCILDPELLSSKKTQFLLKVPAFCTVLLPSSGLSGSHWAQQNSSYIRQSLRSRRWESFPKACVPTWQGLALKKKIFEAVLSLALSYEP